MQPEQLKGLTGGQHSEECWVASLCHDIIAQSGCSRDSVLRAPAPLQQWDWSRETQGCYKFSIPTSHKSTHRSQSGLKEASVERPVLARICCC